LTSQQIAIARMAEHLIEARHAETTRDFCELLRDGARPVGLGMEAMKVASPFLNVPAHFMIKPDKSIRGVAYDHVVLGLWRSLSMSKLMPKQYRELPLTQAIWYMPQGLDVWNQLQCEFPGQYAEQSKCPEIKVVVPKQHFDECQPLLEGSFKERLELMLFSILQGDKAKAFQAFLGLAEDAACDEEKRKAVESTVIFAGIIDVPGPRMVPPTMAHISTAAHKAIRARAMVDVANAIGWENAYPVFFVVIPDLANSPRSYDLLETATTYLGQFGKEALGLAETNVAQLNPREVDDFASVMLYGSATDVFEKVTSLLAAGKSVLSINETASLAASRLMSSIEQKSFTGFSPATHCFDYTNVVSYWLRNYNHPERVKVAYFAPFFVNEATRTVRKQPIMPDDEFAVRPEDYDGHVEQLSLKEILTELSAACGNQDAARAAALTKGYLGRSRDRQKLAETLAFEAAKWEGDPHIARNAMSHFEEFNSSSLPGASRDELFYSWVRFLSRTHKRSYEFNCLGIYQEVLRV
jgi:hypothetical protein